MALGLLVGMLLGGAGSALAHTPSGIRWVNNDTTISYGFDDDTPCCTVDWRLRAVDARDEWNDVGANFSFVASGLTVAGTYNCPTDLPDGVQLVFMDGAFYDDWTDDAKLIVAAANKCTISSQIWYTAVSTNSYLTGEYFKGSDPTQIPNDKYDLQSFFTHELGHAHGTWSGNGPSGHFLPGATVCDGTLAYHTMCPGEDPGKTRWRHLENHDEHTFTSWY